MRWFRIRRANIPPLVRTTFEYYGSTILALYITNNALFNLPELWSIYQKMETRRYFLDWLTEQYDRAERKETWSITMEGAITIFVAAELILSAMSLGWHYHWWR